MKKSIIISIGALIFLACSNNQKEREIGYKNLISNKVKNEISNRVSKGLNQSIVIGVIDSTGFDFFSSGLLSNSNNEKPNINSQYEIGSITKVFTGLLLANKLNNNSLNLNDSIGKFLPKTHDFPDTIKHITLKQLVTHTSGLGRNPSNLRSKGYDAKNPYAHYNKVMMYEELQKAQLNFSPGEKSQYSNFGMAVLGYILAISENSDYANTLDNSILSKINMNNTSTNFGSSNIAQGYVYNVDVEDWDFKALSGAGALKSNVQDMLTFLKAQLSIEASSLVNDVILSQQKLHSIDTSKHIGYAWGIYNLDKYKTLYRHNGGTAGFRSFVGFTKNPKKGVIVITNSGNSGVDDIGMYVLDETNKLINRTKSSIASIVSDSIEKKKDKNLNKIIDLLSNDSINTKWSELNNLGYTYLKKGEIKKAIKVFQLNTEMYPGSDDGYDSLGEAYYNAQEYVLAKKYYEKALLINPNYNNAKLMIQKIEGLIK